MKRATQKKIETDGEEMYNHFTLYTMPLLKKATVEGWQPKCRQDVIDILTEVQVGYISCRYATSILFPELK